MSIILKIAREILTSCWLFDIIHVRRKIFCIFAFSQFEKIVRRPRVSKIVNNTKVD